MQLPKFKDRSAFLGWGICYFIAVGLISVYLGQDICWDLRNYHFYNPYMLLTGRLKYDVLPAQIQTFFNPLMDIPFFVAIYYWKTPPIIVGFLMGGIHGLNLWLIHQIVYHCLTRMRKIARHLLSCLAAITGIWGAAYFSEIGTTIGDSTSSLFVLSSLLILVYQLSHFSKLSLRTIIISGFVLGLGVGLKLTVALYGISLIVAINFIQNNLREKLYNLISIMLAMFSGFLVTAGYWMVLMWINFSNPLFPFFNTIFKSLYIPIDTNFKDARFLPRDIWQTLFYPFYFTQKQSLVAELEFQDSRLAIAYTLSIFFVVFTVINFVKNRHKIISNKLIDSNFLRLILPFYITAYLIWLNQFSIYRYLVVLELLTPVLVILIIGYIYPSIKFLFFTSTILFTIMIATVKPLDWWRIPWTSNYFGIERQALTQYENTVIVIWEGNSDGSSYLIPYFPASTRFVRISGNFGLEKGTLMQKKAEENIENTPNDRLYLLDISPNQQSTEEVQSKRNYQLSVDSQNCNYFSTHIAKYSICPLQK